MYVEEAFMKKRVRSISMTCIACALALGGCASDDEPSTPAGGAGMGGSVTGTAVATIAPLGTNTVTGTATFTETAAGVTVVIALQNCPPGPHAFHIHNGTECTDATTQGVHWPVDSMTGQPPTRGEGIPDITCNAEGNGTVTHVRPNTEGPDRVWNIGDAADANVVGHVVVVHMMPDKMRIGCGKIAAM
jgi:Cu/Zn superoxide dismutase